MTESSYKTFLRPKLSIPKTTIWKIKFNTTNLVILRKTVLKNKNESGTPDTNKILRPDKK